MPSLTRLLRPYNRRRLVADESPWVRRAFCRTCVILLLLLSFAPVAAARKKPFEDRIRFLRDLVVESNEVLNDVQCFACSVRVRGHVTGDAVSVGGNASIDGVIDGGVVAAGGRVDVRPGGRVGGNAVAVGGYVQRDSGSSVGGEVVSIPYVVIPGQRSPALLGVAALCAFNLFFACLAAAALRFKRVENISSTLEHRSGVSLVVGMVAMAIFWGLMTLVGSMGRAENPADLVILILMLVVAASGAAGLGRRAASVAFPFRQGFWSVLAGILGLSFLEIVPLLGFLVFAGGLTVSMGAALVSRFGSQGASAARKIPA